MAYQIPSREVTWSSVFRQLERHKEELGIIDYSISQTTLEQVSIIMRDINSYMFYEVYHTLLFRFSLILLGSKMKSENFFLCIFTTCMHSIILYH